MMLGYLDHVIKIHVNWNLDEQRDPFIDHKFYSCLCQFFISPLFEFQVQRLALSFALWPLEFN